MPAIFLPASPTDQEFWQSELKNRGVADIFHLSRRPVPAGGIALPSQAGNLQPAGVLRLADRVDTVAGIELGQSVRQVVAYRCRGQEQGGSDRLGGCAGGGAAQHV